MIRFLFYLLKFCETNWVLHDLISRVSLIMNSNRQVIKIPLIFICLTVNLSFSHILFFFFLLFPWNERRKLVTSLLQNDADCVTRWCVKWGEFKILKYMHAFCVIFYIFCIFFLFWFFIFFYNLFVFFLK